MKILALAVISLIVANTTAFNLPSLPTAPLTFDTLKDTDIGKFIGGKWSDFLPTDLKKLKEQYAGGVGSIFGGGKTVANASSTSAPVAPTIANKTTTATTVTTVTTVNNTAASTPKTNTTSNTTVTTTTSTTNSTVAANSTISNATTHEEIELDHNAVRNHHRLSRGIEF